MKKIIFTLLLAFGAAGAFAQTQKLSWEVLANIGWERKYNQKYQQNFNYPKFAEAIKAMEGREVIVKGYVLPMDVGGDYLVISRFPYESCFFCGGAGPESVMEVHVKNPKLVNKKQATFKGRLKLNPDDVDALVYILENAELLPDTQP